MGVRYSWYIRLLSCFLTRITPIPCQFLQDIFVLLSTTLVAEKHVSFIHHIMSVHIPKWILSAFVSAAPILGIVCLILFLCTLLGLVQRCEISLAKSCANRRKSTINGSIFD